MKEQTKEMKTLDSFMSALDGERWGENSGPELTYLLSRVVNFAKSEEGYPPAGELKVVDCGDKLVGVVVLTMDKN